IVLLAQQEISPQTQITPEDLLIKEIPVKYIQPGAVTSLAEVIGQITSVPIAPGEQILKTKLLPPVKVGRTLSEITPQGKRAVTILVDTVSSVGGLIKAGNLVDVFASVSPPAGVEWAGIESKMPHVIPLFQGVEVLAVGGEMTSYSDESSEKRGPRTTAPRTGSSGSMPVTLALKPQEAILLAFVQDQGKIKLVLRSSDDIQQELVKPADWDTLFKYLYPSQIVQEHRQEFEGPPTTTVEIYRGLRREVMPLSQGE
ncbi:MAG: Flp pilus assembly protein CpaB, partial [Candidatus Omnitrophota bacterium]